MKTNKETKAEEKLRKERQRAALAYEENGARLTYFFRSLGWKGTLIFIAVIVFIIIFSITSGVSFNFRFI